MTTNNNKKKSSAARKLIPAIGMLTVSAMMLSSSTYAWFTMNKAVEVTGMEVHTKVGSNLLICTTNKDSDYSANTLIQERKALLEPVSSSNGTTNSFWYTVDAKADGSKNKATDIAPYVQYSESTALANATAGKTKYDTAFNAAYTIRGTGTSGAVQADDMTGAVAPAYGYVDYIFYLKATASEAAQAINMTQCDLTYNGSNDLNQSGTVGDNIDRAWRVAVFAKDINSETNGQGKGLYTATDIAASDTVDDNQKGLISLPNAAYFNNVAITGGTTSAAIVNKATSGVIIGNIVNAGETHYYKVVVRLWLEGADTTCNSKTYAALTNNYKLDMKFELGEGTPVSNISNNTFDATRGSGATQSGTEYDAAAAWNQ